MSCREWQLSSQRTFKPNDASGRIQPLPAIDICQLNFRYGSEAVLARPRIWPGRWAAPSGCSCPERVTLTHTWVRPQSSFADKLKPSSRHPVIPPIMTFTGRPS